MPGKNRRVHKTLRSPGARLGPRKQRELSAQVCADPRQWAHRAGHPPTGTSSLAAVLRGSQCISGASALMSTHRPCLPRAPPPTETRGWSQHPRPSQAGSGVAPSLSRGHSQVPAPPSVKWAGGSGLDPSMKHCEHDTAPVVPCSVSLLPVETSWEGHRGQSWGSVASQQVTEAGGRPHHSQPGHCSNVKDTGTGLLPWAPALLGSRQETSTFPSKQNGALGSGRESASGPAGHP